MLKRRLCVLALGLCLAAPAAAQVETRLPLLQGAPGSDLVVPVWVNPPDGVTTLDLSFAYDPAVVAPTGVFRTGATQDYALSFNLDVPGRVDITLTGDPLLPVIDPDGEKVAWIVFQVLGTNGAASPLDWLQSTVDGSPGLPEDGAISVGDADSIVSMPDDALASSGQNTVVPITASEATGALGIDLTVNYNGSVIHPLSVSKSALTQSMTLTTNTNIPGQLRVSLFSASPISGSGTLVNVTFQAVGDDGEVTPLDVVKARINEGGISTVLDDGLFRVCSAVDGDEDNFSSCAGDCNDGDADVFPGAPELCDGKDNNCDGQIDNVVPPTGIAGVSMERLSSTQARIEWAAVPGADGYDVVAGDLSTLRAAGDLGAAVDDCVAEDLAATSLVDDRPVAPGSGVWYLQRAVSCGVAGSYDSTGDGQQGDRDDALTGAPGACL